MTPPAARPSPRGFFITGTDTGVGKTLLTCALLHAYADQGKRVVGMKPVAAGGVRHPGGLINDDVTQLRAASNVDAALTQINPYCFEAPIAPHLAAEQSGIVIDLATIFSAFEQLAASADLVVVEGVGGFCVPLNNSEDSADLAQRLGLPVILVVGMRLGCLNHALLTADAIRANGLACAGWIANRLDPAMALADRNVAALAERLPMPLLGDVEFTSVPDPKRIVRRLTLPDFV